MTLTRRLALLAIVFAAVAVLAGCGGGSSSNSSTATATESSGSGSSGSEASGSESISESSGSEATFSVEPPPTTEVTKNPVTTPLAKTPPPKGEKIIFMQCELPICALYVKPVEEAAEALGWESEAIVFKSDEPGKGISTALQKDPNFIVVTSIPLSVIKQQVKEAHEQGVEIIGGATPEQASPEGWSAMIAGTEYEEGQKLAQWMANDAHGEAHTLGLVVPLYAILETEAEGVENVYAEGCPGCSYESLDLTAEDIGGGGVPQKVVAYLQSHPEVNYVMATFSDLTDGLSSALQAAGYSGKVKIVSGAANSSIVQEIPDKIAAAVLVPFPWSCWTYLDAAARLANGEKLSKQYLEEIYYPPTWLVDSEETAESLKSTGYEWAGPGMGAFTKEYEALWGVG
jgi:ABC-type sugar transport system substrate-binding protein